MRALRNRGGGRGEAQVTLFGSGTILRGVLAGADLLEHEFDVSADIYSVTSFGKLRRNAFDIERWKLLQPTDSPKQPYFRQTLGEREGPSVAATDDIEMVRDQIRQWVPGRYTVLGTDGFAVRALRGRACEPRPPTTRKCTSPIRASRSHRKFRCDAPIFIACPRRDGTPHFSRCPLSMRGRD